MAATLTEKVTNVALRVKDVIQEANETAGLETSGTLGERLDKLISTLGINLTFAAGASLDAARKGSKELTPADTPTVTSAPMGAPSAGGARRRRHGGFRAANKRFEISKFKFEFPRARTYELIRSRSRLYKFRRASPSARLW